MRGTSLEVSLILSGMMIFKFLVHSHCLLTAAVRLRRCELLSVWRAMDNHMVLVAASMKPDALLLKPMVCDLRPHLSG